MSRAEPCRRALALIERRLFEPITLGEIALESGLSPFLFSRLFTALYGQSVMAHVRGRRLAAAAGRLLGPLHPQMASALGEIWGERLQAAGLKPSGGPDFELYPEDFDQDRPGAVLEFWIPVQA